MDDIDILNFRWQLVRSLELQQTTELDNIRLRKKIKELEQRLDESSKSRESLKQSVIRITADKITSLKKDLFEFKNTSNTAINASIDDIINIKGLIDTLNNEFAQTLEKKNDFIASLQQLNEKHMTISSNVSKELEEANEKIKQLLQRQSGKIDDFQGKIAKLREKLGEADHNKAVLEEKYHDMKDKYTNLYNDKEALATKTDLYYTEIKRLKVVNTKLDEEILQLKENQHCNSYNLEALLSIKNVENEQLVNRVNELLQRIAYLQDLINKTNSSKSNFAKFVELKTENVQLQSKLNTTITMANHSAVSGITPINTPRKSDSANATTSTGGTNNQSFSTKNPNVTSSNTPAASYTSIDNSYRPQPPRILGIPPISSKTVRESIKNNRDTTASNNSNKVSI